MKNGNDLSNTSKSGKLSLPFILLFAGLFIVASIGAAYLYNDNNNLVESGLEQEQEIEALEVERENLQEEMMNIETSFQDKISENENLSNTLTERVREIETLQWRLSDARKKLKSSQTKNSEIISRLGQLEVLKSELERDIAALAMTNTELKSANDKIGEELKVTNEYAESLNEHLVYMSEKNSRLIERLYALAPAGFIAENFEVKTEKRNDKLTSKAKYTDEVKVRFDLNNVPKNFHGEEEIYLVLAKFDGQPVAQIPSKSINIVSKETFTIKAADIEKLELSNQQQLDMSIQTDKDLEAGTYNLMVYADHGFLGATSFQLR